MFKKMQEEMLFGYAALAHTFTPVVARVANPFGVGQATGKRKGLVVASMLRAMRGEPIMIYGDGSQVRDYLFIDDAVDALLLLGAHPKAAGHVWNVGSGIGRSISEVVADVVQVVGGDVQVGLTGERSQDVAVNYLDIRRIEQVCGWRPRSEFQEALKVVYRQLSDRGLD